MQRPYGFCQFLVAQCIESMLSLVIVFWSKTICFIKSFTRVWFTILFACRTSALNYMNSNCKQRPFEYWKHETVTNDCTRTNFSILPLTFVILALLDLVVGFMNKWKQKKKKEIQIYWIRFTRKVFRIITVQCSVCICMNFMKWS